jgi:tRNA G46 methylase TrmB
MSKAANGDNDLSQFVPQGEIVFITDADDEFVEMVQDALDEYPGIKIQIVENSTGTHYIINQAA